MWKVTFQPAKEGYYFINILEKPKNLDKGPESCLGLVQDSFKPMGFLFFFLLVSMGFGSGRLQQLLQTSSWMEVGWRISCLRRFGEAAKEEGERCY